MLFGRKAEETMEPIDADQGVVEDKMDYPEADSRFKQTALKYFTRLKEHNTRIFTFIGDRLSSLISNIKSRFETKNETIVTI
ncbi:hypothetical protein ECANGB1_237 [Enterospora canceri]|uniref:Uncharacterized protein n=1 Tax=Enterospora canceri TaxID=1081671 RepID=A0A1Y1S890_9MICR|nr:hypothetical protein ECANGB1_237 [Enterospora canceri]